MLLLNINRKSYMGTLIALSHLTLHMLGNLERSYLRSLIFWSPISHEGAKLGHMLLININGKPYTWEVLIFDLQWPWKIKVKVTQILMSYIRKGAKLGLLLLAWYQICTLYLYFWEIWNLDITQENLLAGGVFHCPSSLSCFLLSTM